MLRFLFLSFLTLVLSCGHPTGSSERTASSKEAAKGAGTADLSGSVVAPVTAAPPTFSYILYNDKVGHTIMAATVTDTGGVEVNQADVTYGLISGPGGIMVPQVNVDASLWANSTPPYAFWVNMAQKAPPVDCSTGFFHQGVIRSYSQSMRYGNNFAFYTYPSFSGLGLAISDKLLNPAGDFYGTGSTIGPPLLNSTDPIYVRFCLQTTSASAISRGIVLGPIIPPVSEPPSTPTIPTFSAVTANGFTASWSPVGYPEGYFVKLVPGIASAVDCVHRAADLGAQTSATYNGLTPGFTYTVGVCSYDASHYSNLNAAVAQITLPWTSQASPGQQTPVSLSECQYDQSAGVNNGYVLTCPRPLNTYCKNAGYGSASDIFVNFPSTGISDFFDNVRAYFIDSPIDGNAATVIPLDGNATILSQVQVRNAFPSYTYLNCAAPGTDATGAIPPNSVADPVIADAGFETPVLKPATYSAAPAGSWNFTGEAGIASNGAAILGSYATNAPQGKQVAVINQNGSVSQRINFSAKGTFYLSIATGLLVVNCRDSQIIVGGISESSCRNSYIVSVDDAPIADLYDTAARNYTTVSSVPFAVSAGVHTLKIQGQVTGRNTWALALDNVSIQQTALTPSNVGNLLTNLPPAPTKLIFTDVTPASFTAAWTADPKGPTNFLTSIHEGNTPYLLCTDGSPALNTKQSFSSLVAAKQYTIAVCAINPANNELSNPLIGTVTTQQGVLRTIASDAANPNIGRLTYTVQGSSALNAVYANAITSGLEASHIYATVSAGGGFIPSISLAASVGATVATPPAAFWFNYQANSAPTNCVTGKGQGIAAVKSSKQADSSVANSTGLDLAGYQAEVDYPTEPPVFANATPYYFRICIQNGQGEISPGVVIGPLYTPATNGQPSVDGTYLLISVPDSPQSLTLTASPIGSGLLANWSSGGLTNVGYMTKLVDGTTRTIDCSYGETDVKTDTSQIITGLTAGATYTFGVCAYNQHHVLSGYGNAVTQTITLADDNGIIQPPINLLALAKPCTTAVVNQKSLLQCPQSFNNYCADVGLGDATDVHINFGPGLSFGESLAGNGTSVPLTALTQTYANGTDYYGHPITRVQTYTPDAASLRCRAGNGAGTPVAAVMLGTSKVSNQQIAPVSLGETVLNKPIFAAFTITNKGTGVLKINKASLVVSEGFSVPSFPVNGLGVGASATVIVSANASQVGTVNGTLSFASNDSTSPFSLRITAVVKGPTPQVSPSPTVTVAPTPTASSVPSAPPSPTAAIAPTFLDPNFASPSLGTGGSAYKYNPSNSAWTFAQSAGIAGNGSAFTNRNANAPIGTQVAFLQGTGGVSQTVTFAAGTYALSFNAALRSGNSSQSISVLVDGVSIGKVPVTTTSYTLLTSPAFTTSAGTHTITLQANNPNGGDNSAFVEAIKIVTR